MATLRPYFKKAKTLHDRATGAGPWLVHDLCAAYSWPRSLPGGGVIAIVELGGGWTHADMQAFATANNLPMPTIVDVSVDATKNTPGQDADGEVALDIQVAWAAYYAATGHVPTIRIYWASDIAPAVRAAIKDHCDVCSISWGADEANWGAAAAKDMEQAAIEAAAAGMIVFAASGDNDSSDGGPTPANVDLPASCPHVVGCGGTLKTRALETVWNDSPGNASGDGTGGGYSTLFPMPAWQLTGGAPKGPGRMVPDVAADADPSTGYEIYYQGAAQVVGGTSAVAPLYAGLFAAIGTKLGFIAPKLWASPSCFSDVTIGNNGMYHAQVGSDPCTGLGAPIGTKIAALLGAAAPAPQPPAPQPPPVPTPQPPPPAPLPTVVTIAEAIAWAESDLPRGPLTRHLAMYFIEAGLRQHWPRGMTNVAIADVVAWAESDLPHATMTRHAVESFVDRGIRQHWPKGLA